MKTKIAEIAPRIYRLSTWVKEILPPAGFTFNQFLVLADEPLLFHCGHRKMFPLVSEAVAKLVAVEKLRWITFGHYEPDESGAMNLWLAAAPKAQVAHGAIGCQVILGDAADRAPRRLADEEVIDLGGKRVRHLDTPHVPHGWDARVLYEETTRTLFCGDLFTHEGNGPALVETSIVEPAIQSDRRSGATCLTPQTALTLRRLGRLAPETLAVMHGSSYRGDCAGALNALADDYDRRVSRR
jgi:flavorubredoxin